MPAAMRVHKQAVLIIYIEKEMLVQFILYPWKHGYRKKMSIYLYTFQVMADFVICLNGTGNGRAEM